MPIANEGNFSLALRERVPEGRVRGLLSYLAISHFAID